MSLIQITPPAVLPISMAEARAVVRLETGDDDALLAGYARTATDLAEQHLGRALMTSTWEYRVDHFPWCRWDSGIRLPLAPVQEVTQITYHDANDIVRVLSTDVYSVSGLPDAALISTATGRSWPPLLWRREAVTITFTAGYGDDWNAVPEAIRAGIGEQVRGYYDGCSNGVAEELLQPYRMRPI